MGPRARYWRTELAEGWRDIGGLGRFGVVGLGFAVVLTLVLGFSIIRAVQTHILMAQADLLANEVAALPWLGVMDPGSPEYEAYDGLVRQELLGGETERVKLWLRTGEVVYSDRGAFVGQQFELSPYAEDAFDGNAAVNASNLTDPAHAPDRELGRLLEFYIPVVNDGAVVAVFEVEQSMGAIESVVAATKRNVWTSIAVGVGALGVFMIALALARTRDLAERRRVAERLLGQLFSAQEEERRHLVGALHDDIGQPLYRILYGLEGSIARIGPATEVGAELERLQNLVRQVDATLRTELSHWSEHLPADAGLSAALGELAATTEAESDLQVQLSVSDDEVLSEVQRIAFYRVAQEGVVNVRKHASASSVIVDAGLHSGRYTLTIRDDGTGGRPRPGLGLTTARERMEALGGWLRFEAMSSGFRLEASVPVGESP